MMERTKENDCQCDYCKNHICIVNHEGTKCLDPFCESNKYHLSHETSKKEEYYTISFDNKWFKVKVIDVQRHHKEYPEITNFEVTQDPNTEDRERCINIISKVYENAINNKM